MEILRGVVKNYRVIPAKTKTNEHGERVVETPAMVRVAVDLPATDATSSALMEVLRGGGLADLGVSAVQPGLDLEDPS